MTRPLRDAIDLPDLAYTLQVGREAMEARLALTVTSMADLDAKLRRCLAAEDAVPGVHRGDAGRRKDALSLWASDEDLQNAVGAWIEKGKFTPLLDLWAQGLAVDWSRLYTGATPWRISLPTYPFARERYWIPEARAASVAGDADRGQAQAASGATERLHPLLHANTSDLSGQRFSSRFTGDEWWLRDHVVRGWRTLPGVAYLELARAAVEASWDGASAPGGIELQDVVWSHPARVGAEGLRLHVGLDAEDGGEIGFEIYGDAAGEDGLREDVQVVVHGRGRARVVGTVAVEAIDVAALRRSCERSFGAEQCYATLERMGLTYGAAHRGLQAVHVGTDAEGVRYVLAEVALPACVAQGQAEYGLHPSVLDSALQASIGLTLDEWSGEAGASVPGLALPFSLERLEVLAHSPERGVVYLRRSAGPARASGDGKVRKLDVDLCDEHGRVCVRLRGFASRVLAAEAGAGASDVLLLAREWQASAVSAREGSGPTWEQHRVLVEPRLGNALGALAARWPSVECELLASPVSTTGERVGSYGVQLFRCLQAILHSRPAGEVLVQVVVPREADEGGVLAALSGLLKSAHQENPRLLGQVVEVDEGASTSEPDRGARGRGA